MPLKAEIDEARVLDHIRNSGAFGATDDEIEQALHMLHQTASARRRGLVLKDFILDSGRTRPTRTGCHAAVWIAATDPSVQQQESEPAVPAPPLDSCRHGEPRQKCILCRTRR